MYSNHQVEAPSKVLVGAVACATTVLVAALTYSLNLIWKQKGKDER